MKNIQRSSLRSFPRSLQRSAIAVALGFSTTAFGAAFELGDSLTMDWDSTFTYGAQFRVQGPQHELARGSNGAQGELDSFLSVVDNAFLINGNDGNNNFATGIVSNRVSLLTEADFHWGDYGLFVRGKAWMDPVYANQATDNDDYASYNPNPTYGDNGGNNADMHEFTQSTDDYMGMDARFLDAFAYGTFYLSDHTLNLRLGRQVISWGEAMLSGGGVGTSINHVDAQVRNVPGLEIKELFLPNGSLFGQLDVTEKINVEAYYQYEWQASVIDPSGTYFSEFDSLGRGGETFMFLTGEEQRIFGVPLNDPDIQLYRPNLAYDPKLNNLQTRGVLVSNLKEINEAREGGQFGVASRFLLASGGEVGVYFVRYHDKTPSWYLPVDLVEDYAPFLEQTINPGLKKGDPGFKPFRGVQDLTADLGKDAILKLLNVMSVGDEALDFSVNYFEDIRLYGLSYSTVLGTTNVATEMTYRPNTPLMTGTVNRKQERNGVFHAHINALHIFGPSWLYDASTLMAEVVSWTVEGGHYYNGTHDPDRLAVQNTPHGWGYSLLWSLDYKNVIQGIDLVVPVYLNHGVEGAMFTTGYREKQLTLSTGLTAKYLSTLEFGINYTTYFGSDADVFQRLLSDRDNIAVNVKYAF